MLIIYKRFSLLLKRVGILVACSILLWKELEDKFSLCNQYSTQEPCSCLYFTQASLIVGAEKFYEIDLKTFEIEGMAVFIWFYLVIIILSSGKVTQLDDSVFLIQVRTN